MKLLKPTLCFVASTYASAGIADEPATMRAALTHYAFSELKSVPLLVNRNIEVGDVVSLTGNEEVIVAWERCFPDLEAGPLHVNGELVVKSKEIRTSLEAILAASGSADAKKLATVKGAAKGELEKSAAFLFENVTSITPVGGRRDLNPDEINPVERVNCSRAEDGYNGYLIGSILVTTVYQGSVSAGLVFEVSGEASAGAKAGKKVTKTIGNVQLSAEIKGMYEQVVLDEYTNGPIAIQSSTVDQYELAKIWVAINEDPETLAELERTLFEYLRSRDPSAGQRLNWWFRDLKEKLGFANQNIDDYLASVFASGKGEQISELEIPDEHWRASAIYASLLALDFQLGIEDPI
ncbi:hypothetical protein [Ruegeria sp. HKCCSP335]|uniref:hypothetical protein n=1 Tax=Ruegeria sp. HKCCSP335 TaxID=2794833 RepID=UPI001AEAAF48|nr:hypothetical protein [Ruegeria sp. HKCCSP335]